MWITYRPDLPGDQVDALRKRVDGVEQMLMSPYPGLKSAVSLQAWGHQLFVDSASDARIDEFIDDLRLNPTVAPEPNGSCVNPQFKGSPLPPDPSGAAGSSAAAAGRLRRPGHADAEPDPAVTLTVAADPVGTAPARRAGRLPPAARAARRGDAPSRCWPPAPRWPC